MQHTIRVVCRFRPENQREIAEGGKKCVDIKSNVITLCDSTATHNIEKIYEFDQVYNQETSQAEVFVSSAKCLVDSAFEGYNATVIAYGQTGTGKTYSMEGILNSPDKKGIIPRMVDYIFEKIQHSSEQKEYKLKCSMIQIYMEEISDLLNKGNNRLSVITHPIMGKVVNGATEEYVNCAGSMMSIMKRGTENRIVAETKMNATSSRSHSIFIVTIEQKDLDTEETKIGKLYMVDLAGSEKNSKTGATGQTLKEGSSINKSLTTLGIVMNCLVTNAKHIPYRDSSLTNLLSDALGGNSNTSIIIACSPSSFNASETFSTLEFGQRAKQVRLKPKANTYKSPQQLDKENRALQAILQYMLSQMKRSEELKDYSTKAMKLMEKGNYDLLVEFSKEKDTQHQAGLVESKNSMAIQNADSHCIKQESYTSNDKLLSMLNKWRDEEKKYKKQIDSLNSFKANTNSNLIYLKEIITKLKELHASLEFDIKNKGFTSEGDIIIASKYIEFINTKLLESIESTTTSTTDPKKIASLECELISYQQKFKDKEAEVNEINLKLRDLEEQRERDIKETSKMKQTLKVITDDSCNKNTVIKELSNEVYKGTKSIDLLAKINEIAELRTSITELKKENARISTRSIEYERTIQSLKIANVTNKNLNIETESTRVDTKESSISGSPKNTSEFGNETKILKTPKPTEFMKSFQPPSSTAHIAMPIKGGPKQTQQNTIVVLSCLLSKFDPNAKSRTGAFRGHCTTDANVNK